MQRGAMPWDVVILGSGIGGGTLGAILAKNGLSVLMVEKGQHPRFAIGESTVPETTFILRVLAARYGVPELAALSTFQSARRAVGTSFGVKRAFSFVTQTRGEEPAAQHCTQFPTLSPPLGPDLHLFRQDADAWMMQVAMRHGVSVQQGVDVVDVRFGPELVELRTREGQALSCRYVVDAGGIQALLPRLLALRQEPCPLKTRSRAIYTHMLGVRPYDRCHAPRERHGLAMPLSESTLHHLFDGGWMWVIPFNNHPGSTNALCSVGLVLDLDRHPETGLSGEEEFRAFINDYPAVRRQFEGAVAARGWVSTGRLQFSSTAIMGDRYFLLPHAAAFVDPLFSSGLGLTFGAINGAAARILAAKADGDWSAARFEPVNRATLANVAYFDRLVSTSYKTFGSFDLWNAWYKTWMLGSLYGSCGLISLIGRYRRSGDPAVFDACDQRPFRQMQATDLPPYAQVFEDMAAIVDQAAAGELARSAACDRLHQTIADSGLWPPSWGPPTAECRGSGAFLLARLPALRSWMSRHAATGTHLRYLQDFAPMDLLRMSAADLRAEWASPLGAPGLLLRDYVSAWNDDWAGADDA